MLCATWNTRKTRIINHYRRNNRNTQVFQRGPAAPTRKYNKYFKITSELIIKLRAESYYSVTLQNTLIRNVKIFTSYPSSAKSNFHACWFKFSSFLYNLTIPLEYPKRVKFCWLKLYWLFIEKKNGFPILSSISNITWMGKRYFVLLMYWWIIF